MNPDMTLITVLIMSWIEALSRALSGRTWMPVQMTEQNSSPGANSQLAFQCSPSKMLLLLLRDDILMFGGCVWTRECYLYVAYVTDLLGTGMCSIVLWWCIFMTMGYV